MGRGLTQAEAISLVNDVSTAFNRFGIFGYDILRKLGLNELPHYLVLIYAWGRGLSTSEEPKPIPPKLAERAKEVLTERFNEKMEEFQQRWEETPEDKKYSSDLTRKEIETPMRDLQDIYDAGIRALDRLSSFTTIISD